MRHADDPGHDAFLKIVRQRRPTQQQIDEWATYTTPEGAQRCLYVRERSSEALTVNAVLDLADDDTIILVSHGKQVSRSEVTRATKVDQPTLGQRGLHL